MREATGCEQVRQPFEFDAFIRTAQRVGVLKAKPSSAKGTFVLSCTLSSTMSPPVRVDIREFTAANA